MAQSLVGNFRYFGLWGRVSGAGLCSPFFNFHFGGAETGRSADVLHDPLGGHFGGSGFLAHLHSLMVTMSQKSSLLQAARSVSRALTDISRQRLRSRKIR